MTGATDFVKMMPGYDFLQTLLKNSGAGLPHMGQWIAPTLDPQELDKRIDELRTVQFWLEQNARMLGATIQAMEVQRMTLSTLKTMNLPLEQLREAMTLRVPRAGAEKPADPPAPAPVQAAVAAGDAPGPAPATGDAGTPGGPVDPMQWWGALTKQFTELAAHALKDVPAAGAPAAAPPPAEREAQASAPKPSTSRGADKPAPRRKAG